MVHVGSSPIARTIVGGPLAIRSDIEDIAQSIMPLEPPRVVWATVEKNLGTFGKHGIKSQGYQILEGDGMRHLVFVYSNEETQICERALRTGSLIQVDATVLYTRKGQSFTRYHVSEKITV